MKILVIPDIHLRKFWRRAVFENVDKVEKVVFLGDYFDPYDEPNLEKDSILMMQNIIDLKKNEPDKYILLIGNHDCHYIWDEYPQSSRYSMWSDEKYNNIFCNNLDLFNIAFVQDDVIFTHAGITEEWKKSCFPELSILEFGKKLASEKLTENGIDFGYLAAISYYRGGLQKAGSCEWADLREHIDHYQSEVQEKIVPLGDNNVYQVFGHTKIQKPLITDKCACLDCQKGFIIDTLTHEISKC